MKTLKHIWCDGTEVLLTEIKINNQEAKITAKHETGEIRTFNCDNGYLQSKYDLLKLASPHKIIYSENLH